MHRTDGARLPQRGDRTSQNHPATHPVVVLTRVRQAGQTSTLRRVFPDHDFVSLDLPSEAEQAEKEPSVFLQRHPPPVILDEVP